MWKDFFSAGCLALALSPLQVHAQLAITETMSSASTNNTQATTFGQGPDFWELTNFGTNTVDLNGYRFNDADATQGGDANSSVFSGVSIGAGESIILVQTIDGSGVTNRDDFIAWWGAANLPANLQVLFYAGNGQSSTGDSIVLWDNLATSDLDYLDRVDFGEAVRGRSFSYDTHTGAHGLISSNGVGAAFTGTLSDDVGSPGKTAGPVALGFTQQPAPASQSTPAGQNATFTAAAKGLPHPRYQWLFQGEPIQGAITPSLTVSNAQLSSAGPYRVVITNGLMAITSVVAVLTVTTSPVPPAFITAPKDANAFVGQTVQFAATVNGSPTPALQWRSNNVDLIGETGNTLTFFDVQSTQAATYSLVASSSAGTNEAVATLTVTAKPRLLITEVHSTGSTGFADWWELTSFETYPINLKGWRWDDNGHSLAANNAYTFTNDIILHPGESVVFTESSAGVPMTPALFRNWWPQLSPDVRIVTYSGGGLGLGSGGDEVNIWNGVTLVGNELSERIAGVTFGFLPFATTFVYDPENPPLGGAMTTYSTNTINGLAANGILTASNGSLGSPGRIIAPIRLTNTLAGGQSVLTWNAANNRNYVIEYKSDLAATHWLTLSNLTATGDSAAISEPIHAGRRFYRVGAVIPFVPQP